jgi:hypothetical protein
VSEKTTTLVERAIDWFQSPVGLTVIAGLAGGVLRWITLKERPRDGIATALAGALTAAFIGPLVAQFFGIGPENLPLLVGVSFITGIGGISIGAIIISLFKDRDLFTALKDALILFLTRGRAPAPRQEDEEGGPRP